MWMRIFYFLVDAAITNAHILYTQNDRVHNPRSALQFRTDLARNLVNNYSSRKRRVSVLPNFATKRPKGPGRQKSIYGIPDELRLNNVGSHMPGELPSYRRCRACNNKTLGKKSKIEHTYETTHPKPRNMPKTPPSTPAGPVANASRQLPLPVAERLCVLFSRVVSMPKVRVRTTEKANWSSEALQRAILIIEQEGYSIRKAIKCTGIPFSSLQKRYKKKTILEPRLGRRTVFMPEVEEKLADVIKKMANIFYGCTATQIRKVAFDYAESMNLKHNFNKVTKMAGRNWLTAFMARNNISVRKPEATSINRITAFNKEEVQLFFKLLEEIME
ncbi:unnamed protein product [Colias eurytheme]|nr:unnamed protein product [Colias eurytheme]